MKTMRWRWRDDSASRSRLLRELKERGFSWFNMSDSPKLAQDSAQHFVELLMEQAPLKTYTSVVQPVAGQRSYAQSGVKAKFHVDGHTFLPSNLLIMACAKPAEKGGDSLLLDSWPALEQTYSQDRAFHSELFHTPRIIAFNVCTWIGPTFAFRDSSLVCTHSPFHLPDDHVGKKFHQWVDNQKPLQFRMEADDVYVVNNHRIIHSRTEFEDLSRKMIRIHAWLSEPVSLPAKVHIDEALRFNASLERELQNQPEWIRERFGLFKDRSWLQYQFGPKDAESQKEELFQIVASLQKQKLVA